MPDERTDAALQIAKFLRRLAEWGVEPQGAWFCGAALRTAAGPYELLVGRLVLRVPGALAIPVPPGVVVSSQEHGVIVGCRELSKEELDQVMQALQTNSMPDSLARAFSAEVRLPVFKEESAYWHFAVSRSDRTQWAEVNRFVPHASYELFGYDWPERGQHALRGAEQPLDDLATVVKRLDMKRGGDFSSNNEQPSLMISCDLPLALDKLEYDKLRKAYRAVVRCGRTLPRSQATLSFVGGISHKYELETPQETGREAGFLLFEILHLSKALEDEVKAVLLYAGTTVAQLSCKARSYPWMITRATAPRPNWHLKLEKTFDVNARTFLRNVRRLLPTSAGRMAIQRLEEAVDLLDSRPFYSLVATGSVAELLLRIRLRRLGKARISKKGGETRGQLGRLQLGDAIDRAESIGAVEKRDAQGLHAIREARNAVHIETTAKRTRRFAEADAIAGFGALINLVDALSR